MTTRSTPTTPAAADGAGSVAVPQSALIEMSQLGDRYMDKATSGRGIPVGGAGNDDARRGCAIHAFVRRLMHGEALDSARTETIADLRTWVRTHNAQRPDDIMWKRFDGTGPLGDMPDGAEVVDLCCVIARTAFAHASTPR